MNFANTIQMNVIIPKNLFSQLKQFVSLTDKSSFINAAIEEKLIRERRINALSILKKNKDIPPAFSDIQDSASYINAERANDDKKRTARIFS
jgi:hypothetical protein